MGVITDEDMENVRCRLNTRPGFDDWEGYTNYAVMTWEKFNEFRQKGEFCDVEVECSNGTLHAHKCVLAAGSPYFKVLLKESKQSTCQVIQ